MENLKRIDERDTMFARMSYRKGSSQYEEYYSRNRHLQKIDDEIREKPEICGEGTATYNPLNSPIAVANFKFLSDIHPFVEGNINPNRVKINPEEMTKKIKGLAKHYGAKLVGVAKMEDYHYYSHRGRKAESYGQEVKPEHPYGIVFAIEMDKEMINRAPQIAEVVEVSKTYVDAAVIGMLLSYYIRELGYDARNHMDGNYLVVAPLVARDADLGDIGRNGILITKQFGSRVRLGVVTTDMPLTTDERIDFGLEDFCKACKRCVRTCPGKAIPSEDPKDIDGVERWQIKQEDCYKMWRSIGTDCGICITSCPFSQGIDNELIEKMKDSKEVIDKILKEHDEKHGIRPYIKDLPEWLK